MGHVGEMQFEAGVRAVQAVFAYGLVIVHAREGQGDVHVQGLLEHTLQQPLGQGHDLLLVDEAHLDVDLGEFWLPVRAQVLVAEASADLVVALQPGHHAHLLEQLRGLGKGEELPLVDTAGHQEVAGAFRGALGQAGGLHLDEVLVVKIAAGGLRGLVTQAQVAGHPGAAQVQITVLQAQVLGHVHAVLDEEGRGLGGVHQLPFGNHDLDLAGGEIGVEHAIWAGAYAPLDGQDVFGTQQVSALVDVVVVIRLNTTWVRPSRSRRSMKINPPWSRLN